MEYNKDVNNTERRGNMAKSANLYARIEPEVKTQAEEILTQLGIPASNAINMFYKQIILRGGLPFEVKLPSHPLNVGNMTADKFDEEMQKGYDEAIGGRVKPATEVFSGIRKKYDL